MAQTAWLSKKQATIETSVFGAEFVAMKLDVEHLRSLCYKLRMMVFQSIHLHMFMVIACR